MKLTDFDKKDFAPKALKENYKMDFDVSKMNMSATKNMLKKVRTLAMEAQQSPAFHQESTNPSYMKLVFMEQALVSHYNELLQKPTQIVVENEEVEKSQVVLAAQDMVDSVQKMLEDVGQMQVKELPALVASIESEIGVNESQTYNDQVSAQLDSLSAALKEAYSGLKEALNAITGQGGSDFGAGMGDLETGAEDLAAGDEELDAGMDELGAEPAAELPAEEPEVAPIGGAGRAKR